MAKPANTAPAENPDPVAAQTPSVGSTPNTPFPDFATGKGVPDTPTPAAATAPTPPTLVGNIPFDQMFQREIPPAPTPKADPVMVIAAPVTPITAVPAVGSPDPTAATKPTGLLFSASDGGSIDRIHTFARDNPETVVKVNVNGSQYEVPAVLAAKMATDDSERRTHQAARDQLQSKLDNVLRQVASGQVQQHQPQSQTAANPAQMAQVVAAASTTPVEMELSPHAVAAIDRIDKHFVAGGEIKTALTEVMKSVIADVHNKFVLPMAYVMGEHEKKISMVEPLGADHADIDELTTIINNAVENDPTSPLAGADPTMVLAHMRAFQNGMIGQPNGPKTRDEAYGNAWKNAAFQYATSQIMQERLGGFTITAPAVGKVPPTQPSPTMTLEQTVAALQQQIAQLQGRGAVTIPTSTGSQTGNGGNPQPVNRFISHIRPSFLDLAKGNIQR